MHNVNACAQRLHPQQMEIDGTRTDRAAAGQRYLRAAKPGEQRAEDEKRGAHPAHEVFRCFAVQVSRRYAQRRAGALHTAAERAQYLAQHLDVFQVGHIVNRTGAFAEQGGGQYWQDSVLGTGCADTSLQACRPGNGQV